MIIVVIVCVRMKTRSVVDRLVIWLFPPTFESFGPIRKNRGKNINKELILNCFAYQLQCSDSLRKCTNLIIVGRSF